MDKPEIDNIDDLIDLAINQESRFIHYLRENNFELSKRFLGKEWKARLADLVTDKREFADYLEDEFDPEEWEIAE